jgi:EAL domain-containing protein (putative c-di-GMP-specific phosphodiesterase class I)
MMERAELQVELRHAIADGEIRPYYQPLVDLRTGALAGVEVLARWQHPVKGMLMPGLFVPLVEKMRLCDELFLAMLARACADAATWPAPVRISVNMSPAQLEDLSLAERIRAILDAAGFDPALLVVEITESLPIHNSQIARQVLTDIRASGIAIALDDFGTGHSSLSLLRDLSFDKVKIDRGLINPLAGDAGNTRYIAAIIGLGQALDLEITAEGIETAEMMQTLRALGCAIGQGYLFGKPAPAAAVPGMIWRFRADAAPGSRVLQRMA